MNSTLLMSAGAWWASQAALGSLLRSSLSVLVVNMRAPAGWMIVFVGSWMSALVAGALVFNNVLFGVSEICCNKRFKVSI